MFREADAKDQPMTSTLYACYKQPTDTAAFDEHYAQTHSKLASQLPGLLAFTGTKPAAGPDGSAPTYYYVAALTFDSDQALGAALSSPQGEATVADLANFAGAGVDLMSGSTTVYV